MYKRITVLSIFIFSNYSFAEKIKNPLIDYNHFKSIVIKKNTVREPKRLTESQFIKAIQSKDYILLDARSLKNYNLRHIQGAINLPFTEFDKKSLEKIIPNLNSKILIYCNNNFKGSPVSFEPKAPAASLNLSTQINLQAYGYNNVFELGPLLNIKTTKIKFSGTEVSQKNITK